MLFSGERAEGRRYRNGSLAFSDFFLNLVTDEMIMHDAFFSLLIYRLNIPHSRENRGGGGDHLRSRTRSVFKQCATQPCGAALPKCPAMACTSPWPVTYVACRFTHHFCSETTGCSSRTTGYTLLHLSPTNPEAKDNDCQLN